MNEWLFKLDNAESTIQRFNIIRDMFSREDAPYIIKDILSELSKRDYFITIVKRLFIYSVDYPEILRDEIMYLLNLGHYSLLALRTSVLCNLVIHIPEIFEMVLDRLNENSLMNEELVRDLTYTLIYDETRFLRFASKVLSSKSEPGINYFFKALASNHELEDYSAFLPFIKNSNVVSTPYIMSKYVHVDDNLRIFLIDNFNELLERERDNKMRFIKHIINDLPEDIRRKYDYLVKIVKASKYTEETTKRLNILLRDDDGRFISDYAGNNDVTYLGSGTTSQAFRIGENKVLKLARIKHYPETIVDHFLLAPTERKIVLNKHACPILYVEKQDYLSNICNGIPINQEDFDNYFREIERQHLVVKDPHCLRRSIDNFGFLRDYHDATLVGVQSHEELPEWFKRRPLVIYDIDMITQDNNVKKKVLN